LVATVFQQNAGVFGPLKTNAPAATPFPISSLTLAQVKPLTLGGCFAAAPTGAPFYPDLPGSYFSLDNGSTKSVSLFLVHGQVTLYQFDLAPNTTRCVQNELPTMSFFVLETDTQAIIGSPFPWPTMPTGYEVQQGR